MAKNDVKFTVTAVDKASPVLKKVDKSFDSTAAGASALRRKMAYASAGIAASLGTVAIAAVNMAATFEKEMANISTLIDTSVEDFGRMKEEVLDVSTRLPVALSDLTQGLYNIRSAGVSAADSMLVLERSGQLAVAGLGTTTEAVDLATSAINSFSLEGDEADKAFNTIFLTVKNGKTTVAELAQSFGMVAGTASAAGVPLEELMAATAALTTTGLKASVAQTQLRSAILAIQAPTKDMKKLFDKAGIASGQNALKNIGLVKTMEKITKASGGNAEAMKKAFGSVEALGAAISLTGEQSKAYQDTMASMESDVTALDEAFAKQNETFSAQAQVLKNQLNTVMISLGTAILPALTSAVQALNTGIQVLVGWFQSLPGPVQDGIAMFGILVIGTLAAVTAVAALKIALGGLIAVAAPILAALGPVIAVIAAIVAGVTLARVAWERDWGGIQAKTQAFWAFIFETIPAGWEKIKGWFSEGLEFISNLWSNIWDGIKSVGETVIGAIVTFFTFQFNFMKDFLVAIFESVVSIANAFFLLFQGDWQGAWEAVSWAFQNIWNVLSEYFQIILNKIAQIGVVFYKVFKAAFLAFINTIKNLWLGGWQYVKDTALSALTWILETFKSFGPKIVSGFSNMISGIGDIAKNIFNGVLDTIEGFINYAIKMLNKVIKAANEVPGVEVPLIPTISFGRLAHGGVAGEGFFGGQKMATGGVVTGGGGIDKVPTLLSAGEVVLNHSQQSNLANQLDRQSGGGSVTIQITGNNFYGDDDSFVEKIGDSIIEKFSQHTAFPSF